MSERFSYRFLGTSSNTYQLTSSTEMKLKIYMLPSKLYIYTCIGTWSRNRTLDRYVVLLLKYEFITLILPFNYLKREAHFFTFFYFWGRKGIIIFRVIAGAWSCLIKVLCDTCIVKRGTKLPFPAFKQVRGMCPLGYVPQFNVTLIVILVQLTKWVIKVSGFKISVTSRHYFKMAAISSSVHRCS